MAVTAREGLSSVRARVAAACERTGRAPDSVCLVAVSKRHPAERIREAYEAGQRDFGENYVQEMVDKAAALADLDGIRWHLIGHLQRNKARSVVPLGAIVQCLDSARLADEIEKRASAASVRAEVFVQVNVGGETQKSGCTVDDAPALASHLASLPSVHLRGLMTVPPASEDPEGARTHFARLRALGQNLGLSELSMGMSHDLEVAIEEGATVVRVGTAIFGPRP